MNFSPPKTIDCRTGIFAQYLRSMTVDMVGVIHVHYGKVLGLTQQLACQLTGNSIYLYICYD